MIWLFLLIPVFAIIWAKKNFPGVVGPKLVIPFVAGFVAIGATNYATEWALTRDKEYWGGWLTQASYYEPWDERVSCCHLRYCTDSKGKSYVCGTEHTYDVAYHGPVWELYDSNRHTWSVDQATFDKLCAEWRSRVFVNLHRRYHSINGNEFRSTWDGKYETLHPTVVTHTFENRIAASDSSILRTQDVSAEERAALELFEYPASSFFTPCVLGYAHPGNMDLDKMNAMLAAKEQIRVWLLCYHNKPRQAGLSQENYWKLGKKNELVVCAGLDKDEKIQWAHVFSWSEREDLKIEVRQWLEDRTGKTLDTHQFAEYLRPEIEKKWKRREFADFSFIAIKRPLWTYVLIGLVVSLSTAGSVYMEVKS